MPPQDLTIIIRAVNQAQATLTQMQGSLQQILAVQQQLTQSNVGMGQSAKVAAGGVDMLGLSMGSLAQRIERALVFFVAFRAFWSAFNFITDAVNALVDLEQQIKRVQSATIFDPKGMIGFAETWKVMTQAMIGFGVSAKQAGDALFELISAGLTRAEALRLLPTVLELVKAGVSDIGTASRASAAIFRVWGVDAQKIGDTLAFVLNQSQSEINGLVTAMQRVAATANISGLSFEQTAVAIATMNNQMIFGGTAGRSLRRVLEQVAQDADFLEERFDIVIDRTKDLGSQFESIFGQLFKVIQQRGLKFVLGEMAELFSKFGIQGAQGVAALTRAWEDYVTMMAKLKAGDAVGSLQAIATIRMDSTVEQFARLKAALSAAFPIEFLGFIKELSRSLADMGQFGVRIGDLITNLTRSALQIQGLKAAVAAGEKARFGQISLPEQITQETAKVTEMWTMLKKLAPDVAKEFEGLLVGLRLIPAPLAEANKQAAALEVHFSALSKKTADLLSNMTGQPIGEQLAAQTARIDEIWAVIGRRVKAGAKSMEDMALQQKILNLDLTTEADRLEVIRLARTGALRVQDGLVLGTEKEAAELSKVTKEHAALNKVLTDFQLSMQAEADRVNAAFGLQIGYAEKLNVLKAAELVLQKQLADVIERQTGITAAIVPGQRPVIPPAALFDKEALAEIDKLVKSLGSNLIQQWQTADAWSKSVIIGLEKQISLIERTAVLQLKDINLKEQIARAMTIVTATMEKAFNAERLKIVTDEIVVLQEKLKALQDAGTLGIFGKEGAEAIGAKIAEIAAKLQTLREEQTKLSLTQQSDLDSFLDGVRRGVSELSLGFKQLSELGLAFVRDLKNAISEGIFNTLTKGFKGFGDFLTKIRDSALKLLSDFAASKIISFFGGFLPNATLPNLATNQMNVVAGTVSLSGAALSGFPVGSFQIASAGDSFPFPEVAQQADAAAQGLEKTAKAANAAGGDLGFFGQLLGWLGGIMSVFGSAIGGLIQFIGAAISAIVSFVSTGAAAGAGGAVGGVGGGTNLLNLANIGSSLFSVLSGGLEKASQFIFNALESGVTLFAGEDFAFSIGPLLTDIADWAIPVIGTAISVIMDLISGNIRGASLTAGGAIAGGIIFGPIGAVIGGIIGKLIDVIIGLFEGPPTARLYVQLQSTFMGKQREFLDKMTGSFGAHVSADLPDAEANKIRDAILDAMNQILRALVGSIVKAQRLLPSSLTETMNRRLAELADRSPFLAKGEIEIALDNPDHLRRTIEALPGKLVKVLAEAVFGGLDITQFQQAGEQLVDTFGRILGSMAAVSELGRLFGVDMEMVAASLGEGDAGLRAFAERSVAFFTQFAKEGETFADTLTRVVTAFAGLHDLMQANRIRIAQLSGDTAQAISLVFETFVSNVERSEQRLQQLADQFTIAVESGAQPDEILAMAKALTEAVDQNLQAINALVNGLKQIRVAVLSAADFLATLTVEIAKLGGERADVFTETLAITRPLWAQFANDVMSRIALFNSGLKVAASDVSLLAQALPILKGAFADLMAQIRAMPSAAGAIAALQALFQGIQAGLSAAISSTQASFAAQREAIQGSGQARIDALNREKTAIQEAFTARREALNKELALAQQWANVLKSVEAQLKDLFNLLAPTQPLTSFQDVLGQFRAAFSAFQDAPTPEGAQRVQELGAQALQLAQGVPGMDLPSLAFQAVADEIRAALEAIAGVAGTGRTVEQIQEEIAALETEQAATLKAIDATIQATSNSVQAQLAALSSAERAAISSLELTAASALRDIRTEVAIRMEELRLQELAASEALKEILGDKSFEQFIAEKQALAANMLTTINETLEHYLSIIARKFAPEAFPSAQHGMYDVPRTGPVLVHRGEMILPSSVAGAIRSGSDRGEQTVINFAPTITIHADSGTNGRRVADDIVEKLIEQLHTPSRLRVAVQKAAKN